MKKLLLLVPVFLLLLAACEGPAGRDGLDGNEPYWFVQTYTIQANDWQLVNSPDQLGSYFQVRVPIAQLNRDIYEDGLVSCYMFQRNSSNTEVQTPLPFTNHYGVGNNENEHLWTETFSYDYTPGFITFYVCYSDFFTSNRPDKTSFRVVLNY